MHCTYYMPQGLDYKFEMLWHFHAYQGDIRTMDVLESLAVDTELVHPLECRCFDCQKSLSH